MTQTTLLKWADDPERRRQYMREYSKANRKRLNELTRLRRLSNLEAEREKRREYFRKSTGLPQPTYPAPDECECCGKLPDKGSHFRLYLDHCHSTGKFRGWLCNRCNLAIGKLGDNIEGVKRALDYLLGTAK